MRTRNGNGRNHQTGPSLGLPTAICAIALLLGGLGAARSVGAEGRLAAPGSVQAEVERGPVRLAIQLDPSPARVSDDLKLTVTVDCQPGVTIRDRDVSLSPEDFVVRQSVEVPRKLERQREVLQRVYTLEPARPGRLAIPPVRVTFAETQPGGNGAEGVVRSEAFEVEVTSMVTGIPSLEMLRRPANPVGLSTPGGAPGWILWIVVAVVVFVATAILWLSAGQRPAGAIAGISAREEAQRGLKRLLDAGVAAAGDLKGFYSELSEVVRRYLQRTTGIRAMEQTTEESLDAVAARRSLPAEAAASLRGLLESADLVKFAAHRPGGDEVEKSIRQASFCIDLQWGEAES